MKLNRLPDGGVVQRVKVAAVAPAQGRGVKGEVSANLWWYKKIFACPEQQKVLKATIILLVKQHWDSRPLDQACKQPQGGLHWQCQLQPWRENCWQMLPLLWRRNLLRCLWKSQGSGYHELHTTKSERNICWWSMYSVISHSRLLQLTTVHHKQFRRMLFTCLFPCSLCISWEYKS